MKFDEEELAKVLPKQITPPTEADREVATLEWFDRNLGAGDELAYKEILLIAKGLVTEEHLDRNGNPSTKRPSYSDRLAAWDMLINRHRGRPAQKVEVTTKSTTVEKWDPSKLEIEDLKELKRLHAKVTSDIIEAEFTTGEGPKK